jgi:hypothetical protein
MRWAWFGCIMIVGLLLTPGIVMAKGKPGIYPVGELYVFWYEHETNDIATSWWDSQGFESFSCIVGMYDDDYFDEAGQPYLQYWQEVPVGGGNMVKWVCSRDCPDITDGDSWWINIYLNAWVATGGPTGSTAEGPCVYSEKVTIDLDKNTWVFAYPEVYKQSGCLPTVSVQWVGTTYGLPKAEVYVGETSTWTWKAGFGLDATAQFVTTALGVTWSTSRTVTAGAGIPYSSVVSEGVMVGHSGALLYRFWDVFDNELRVAIFPTEESKLYSGADYSQKIQPTYEEAMEQISDGNYVDEDNVATRTFYSSAWINQPFPCTLGYYSVDSQLVEGWSFGGKLGLGAEVRVGFQVEVSHSVAENTRYTRYIVLESNPGPNFKVQTWTPMYLEDPLGGAPLYNAHHVTYCYLVPA